MSTYDNPFDEVPIDADQPPLPPKQSPPLPTKNVTYDERAFPTSVPLAAPMPPPKSVQAPRDPYNQQLIAEMNSPIELTWEGIQRKERELENREQLLLQRDQTLHTREKSLPSARIKNWPVCRPFLYHDIDKDVDNEDAKVIVKRAYIGWYFECFCQFVNMISILAALVVGGGSVVGLVLSIGFLIWNVPVSFIIYRLLYQAARKTKSALYVIYFIFLWWSIVWAAYFFIGIDSYGGGGFFCMIDAFKDNLGAGIIGIICMVAWGLLIVWHLYIFFAARRLFLAAGGMEQARTEMKGTTVGRLALNKNQTNQAANQFV